MHKNAEYGRAAHWMYKETGAVKLPSLGPASRLTIGQPVLRVDRQAPACCMATPCDGQLP